MSITHRYVPTCAGRECSFRLNQIQLCRQRTRVTSGASIHTSAWGQTVEWQSREIAHRPTVRVTEPAAHDERDPDGTRRSEGRGDKTVSKLDRSERKGLILIASEAATQYRAASGSDRIPGLNGFIREVIRFVECLHPVATTTPAGLPVWGPRSARGSVLSAIQESPNSRIYSQLLPLPVLY